MFGRILGFYTKYFAAWVILFGFVAYFWPGLFITIDEKTGWFFAVTIERPMPQMLRLGGGMYWFFALTMFGIGAVLEAKDFKRIAQRPVIILIGSAAQFSIMPLGAFVLANLFGLEREFEVGLILTGSAPGAMASNLMSYIAKADTAYSISLTTVSTLLCPLLTPGLTYYLAKSTLPIPFWPMVLSAVKMVVAPVFIGFAVRHFFREKVEKILPIFPAISVTCIIFICSLVIAENKEHLAEVTGLILAAAVILNIYGMLAGYGTGSAFRMEKRRRRTLAIEIGMQNAGLGVVLAKKHIGTEAALPAALFVFICIITASIMAEVWQKRPSRPVAE